MDPKDPPNGCFPEPPKPDPTPARRTESRSDWLARSTWVRAVECRRIYNENLKALPTDAAEALCRRLRNDVSEATHFELVVGRFLQLLGADVRHEVAGGEGLKIDWVAEFTDSDIAVEVTAPVVNPAIGQATKAAAPVADMLGAMAPAGWHVVVAHTPPLAPGERLSDLRRHFARIFDSLPRGEPGAVRKIQIDLRNGRLEVNLIAATDPELRSAGVSGPFIGYADNTSEVVHRAVAGKRRQARGAGMPVLAALHTGGFGGFELEKFDIALFGRTVVRLDTGQRWLDRSGVFGPGRGQPTFAGALAFAGLGWHGGPDPVLYVHPRFTGRLPRPIMALHRRQLEGDEIIDVPSTAAGVLMRLGWPTS